MSIQHRHRAVKERAEARAGSKREPLQHEYTRASKRTPWPHEYPAASKRGAEDPATEAPQEEQGGEPPAPNAEEIAAALAVLERAKAAGAMQAA